MWENTVKRLVDNALRPVHAKLDTITNKLYTLTSDDQTLNSRTFPSANRRERESCKWALIALAGAVPTAAFFAGVHFGNSRSSHK